MASDYEHGSVGFEELLEKLSELYVNGRKRSTFLLAEDIRRRARESRQLIPYLYANFYSMNCAQSLFDHRVGTERAIETIAILESEEKAREIQPQLPVQEYEETIAWMTACAYDNLAKHYAMREGYGDEQLQGLVQEGFDVCRRTGKLQCLTCFRGYAVNVYETAGDLELAMHFARSVFRDLPLVETNDRRSEGACNYAFLLMLAGQLEEASRVAEAGLSLVKASYEPLSERIRVQCQLGQILSLLGRGDELEERCAVLGEPVDWALLPPREEYPDLILRRDLFDAVAMACCQEWSEADSILKRWDDWLQKQQVWSEWFEVRLRRVALHFLSGDQAQGELLARQLRQEARRRKAWLYLSRLAAMDRGDVPLSPVAFCRPPSEGLFAKKEGVAMALSPVDKEETPSSDLACREGESNVSPAEDQACGKREDNAKTKSALAKQLDDWVSTLTADGTSSEQIEGIFRQMLAVEPKSVTVPEDGARLIYLAGHLAEMFGRQKEVWSWASRLMALYPEDGDVLNLAATAALSAWLAAQQEQGDEEEHRRKKEEEGGPTLETIEKWFRKSLELKPDYPRHYTRAAQFFRLKGDRGMAEWCLARSFALNRNNPDAALGLAQIYSDADRDQDALAVLDLCLREGGSEDADVAWEAGVVAFRLRRYPEALTYFQQAEQWGFVNTWLYFYRAWTLLELGDKETAQADIARFAAEKGGEGLALHVLRAWLARLSGDQDSLREHLSAALAIPIQSIDDLSETGIEKNFQQLYHVAENCLSEDDPIFQQLVDRLFQAGIVPDAILERERKRRNRTDNLNYYICVLRQPLDEAWAKHPACWPHQTSWPAYFAFWGVLARSNEEAEHYALQAQSRCYPGLAPELLSTTLEEGGFFDHPGVVWQGARRYDEDLAAVYLADQESNTDEDLLDDGDFFDDLDEDDNDDEGEDDEPRF